MAFFVQCASHLHDLRRPLGLPGMFLLAGQLHAHWGLQGLGEKGRVSGHIVGTVSAVAACCLHANDLNACVHSACNQGQIGSEHMWVLCASPHTHACPRGLKLLV